MSISEFDVEELVRGMFELDDDVDLFDFLAAEYNIDLYDYCSIIRDLVPLIIVGQSPLTQKVYKGFGKDNMFFIKTEIE